LAESLVISWINWE